MADRTGMAPPAVRPAVVLAVRLDARVYRLKLGNPDCLQACQRLQTRLADTLLSVLQRDLAFVQWAGAGSATPDTMVLTWAQVDPDPHSEVKLDVALRGPRFVQTPAQLNLQFEKWDQAFVRPSYADTALARVWLDTIATRLRTNSDDLMNSVFARLPLTAKVVLDPSLAKVQVSPDTIHAASDPRQQPQFLVRMLVRDTVVIGNVPTPTSDTMDVILQPCSPQGSAYVCQVSGVTYRGQDLPASKLAELMQSATVTQTSLHLWRYRPAPAGRSTNGLVNPQ